MARINLLRGLHRLLVVLWVAWGLTVIGYVTWGWWTNHAASVACLTEDYVAGIEYCPWLFIAHFSKTLAFYRAAQYLIIGPVIVYVTLMSLALALRAGSGADLLGGANDTL